MESILEQFPQRRSEVERLYQESADFRELCQDYEEVRSLVATWRDSDEVSQVTVAEYQTLLKNLETEIMEYLQTGPPTAGLPDQDSDSQPASFTE